MRLGCAVAALLLHEAAGARMTEVRATPLKGNCLYATRAFATGAAVTDERPLVRSRLDDDAELTARVEAAHRRSPFGFQHARSHLAALWTLQSAPQSVIDAIAAKVARDLNKLQAGAATAKAPSKPSPDALNAMLAKRRPQVKKDEAPDPLQAYLKMRKFGVAAEGVLARMQMDGSFRGVLELASTRVVSRTPSRRRRDACQHTQRSRPAPRRRRDTAPPQAAPSRSSSGFER